MNMIGLMPTTCHRGFDIYLDIYCETPYVYVVPKLIDADPKAVSEHSVRFRTLGAAKAAVSRILNGTYLK